jgi:hypothetical protein
MSLIADLVVTSAAAAYAHFGMTLDVAQHHQPQVERTVARVPAAPRKPEPLVARPGDDCPKQPAATSRT